MVLAPGQVYISKKFSGTGWRIGGYKFKAGGNGTWLKWSTFIDDGRVGDSGDMANQLNNSSVCMVQRYIKDILNTFLEG